MAEEESEVELDRLKQELETLLVTSACDEHGHISKSYCAKFCKLVEEHTGRWQVPLPQLQVLRWALCSFVQGTASFPADCEHVRYTLSSLALSVFELLLFFGKDEFPEDPLKGILDSFQECQACLVRHQNVYLLQLRQIIREGGPWASAVLQGILRGAPQDPDQVRRFLGSEASVFLELRVRYLLVCERVQEAMCLAKACSQHPSTGRHLFFLQAYLTCLWKAALHDHLHTQMSVIDGKDAVDIICGCEEEEDDELLLALSRGFLNQQLCTGDMFNLWDLVFVWSKLQLRTNPSTEDFLQQCEELILTATNARAVFPFIKIILAEVGKSGLRFCVEVCARALECDLQSDPVTKSLLYKTVAFLLPSDLEVCRVCALLVFFLERSVESYKSVSLLYKHPDVEYCADACPVGNHVRFEVLQILKKGLYFDPEFWNFLTLRSTCMSLLRDPLAKAELSEILADEDEEAGTWTPTCCTREPCMCSFDHTMTSVAANTLPLVSPAPCEQRKPPINVAVCADGSTGPTRREIPYGVAGVPKRRGRKPSVKLADGSSASRRRSFRQLDMVQQNLARQLGSGVLSRQQRLLSRQAERRGWKRRGRKPRWLLEEEAAAQAENNAPGRGRRPGRKPGRKPQTAPGQMRTYERSPSERSRSKTGIIQGLGDGLESTPLRGQSETLEFSLPDNELLATWTQASSPPPPPAPRCVVEHSSANSNSSGERITSVTDSASFLQVLQLFSESGAEATVATLPNMLSAVRQFHSYARAHQEQGVQLEPEADPELARRCEAAVRPLGSASDPQVVDVVEMEVTTTTSTPLHNADQLSQASRAAVDHTRLAAEPCLAAPGDALASDSSCLHGSSVCICDSNHLDGCDALRAPSGLVALGAAVMAAQRVPVSAFSTAEAPPIRQSDTARRQGEWPQEGTPKTPAQTLLQSPAATALQRKPPRSELSHTHTHTQQSSGPPSTPEPHQMASSATPASALAPSPAPAPTTQLEEPPLPLKMAAPPDHSSSKTPLAPQPQVTPSELSLSAHINTVSPEPPTSLQPHTPCQMAVVQHTPSELAPVGVMPGAVPPESLPPGMQPAEMPRPAVAMVPESPVLVHCCRLCHKVFRGGNIMRHAYSHYRGNQLLSPGKCMFCDEPPADPDEAYEHFSCHVERLRVELASAVGEARENGSAAAHTEHLASGPLPRPMGNPRVGRRKKGWRLKRKHAPVVAEQASEGTVDTQAKSEHQYHLQRPNGKIRRRKQCVQEGEEGSTRKECRPLRMQVQVSSLHGEKHGRRRRVRHAGGPASSESQDKVGVTSQLTAGEQQIAGKPKLKRKAHKAEKRPPSTPASISSQSEGSVQEATLGQLKLLGESSARSAGQGQTREPPELVACPVQGCPVRLQGRGAAVLGHLLQEHPSDGAGFRSAFEAAEGRCLYCTRRFSAFQHYYDHVGRHSNVSLRHPCPHQGCPEAFRRLAEMRGHVKERHTNTLRLQCCFASCAHTAQNYKELHCHERAHYYTHTASRPRDVRLVIPNGEARDAAAGMPPPPPPLPGLAPPVPDAGVPGQDPTPAVVAAGVDVVPREKTATPDPAGASDMKPCQGSEGHQVWQGSLSSSASHGEPKGLVNGHSNKAAQVGAVAGPKAEKEGQGSAPASSAYGCVAIKPFVRPLPCAYLDEKYTSMPKRRKEMLGAARQVPLPVVEVASAGSGGGGGGSSSSIPQRQRCSRCSTSLANTEELQEHLKKCKALFGFDSDEEGGW